jgi:hypothetical protein
MTEDWIPALILGGSFLGLLFIVAMVKRELERSRRWPKEVYSHRAPGRRRGNKLLTSTGR